jgi:hypothetical protein
MQILEDDPGGIVGFDMFEETLYVGMRGLGRISMLIAHAHDVGGFIF